MTTLRAVRVSTVDPKAVDNFFDFVNQASVDAANVQALPLHRWIPNNTWGPGQNPANNDIWDGRFSPATFTAPAPATLPPADLPQAQAAVDAAQAQEDVAVTARKAAQDALQNIIIGMQP